MMNIFKFFNRFKNRQILPEKTAHLCLMCLGKFHGRSFYLNSNIVAFPVLDELATYDTFGAPKFGYFSYVFTGEIFEGKRIYMPMPN